MRPVNPNSKTQIVRSMLDAGVQVDVIARRVDWNLQRVREVRSRWRRPDGVVARPREEVLAEHRARIEKRLATIKPLLDRGLSWGQAANRLGISKGAIAGLMHRNPPTIARRTA